jgi:hypothetical protein
MTKNLRTDAASDDWHRHDDAGAALALLWHRLGNTGD